MVCQHVWISGKVQGVWFRESLREQAEANGVRGWTRNLPDGRVEAVLEGEENAVERVLAWCHRGPSAAVVAGVEARKEISEGSMVGFIVRR
jgi:acylphosphatase